MVSETTCSLPQKLRRDPENPYAILPLFPYTKCNQKWQLECTFVILSRDQAETLTAQVCPGPGMNVIATGRKLHQGDFRPFAERYQSWMQQIAPDELKSFFASFDSRLAQIMEMIPAERLHAFRRQSVENSIRVARDERISFNLFCAY